MAIKQLQSKLRNDKAVWEKLDVLPEDLYRHPTITPILINSLGSIPKVIDYLRGSDAPEAIEVVRIWDESSKKAQKIVPFEGFCLAAKTTPKKMIGIIMQTVLEQSNVASELLVSVAHPEIIQKTIKIAKTKAGVDERKAILQNRGFLPAPKNQTFNNFGQITQDNRQQTANIGTGGAGFLDKADDEIADGIDRFNDSKRIPASCEVPMNPVLAEIEDE